MSQTGETFFTSIGCMDGRVQFVVAKFGQELFQAEFPDTITEAGLVGQLANNPSYELLEAVKSKILISVQKHNSRGILVHGHQECAGNPVDDEKHKSDVLKATEIVRSMVVDIEVKPLFIIRTEKGWEAMPL